MWIIILSISTLIRKNKYVISLTLSITVTLTANFILSNNPIFVAGTGPIGGPIISNNDSQDATLLNNYQPTESYLLNEEKELDSVSLDGTTISNISTLKIGPPSPNNTNKTLSYFAVPTSGRNWGALHDYNAVDIANKCGNPVFAANEGLVIESRSAGWNTGYGNFIEIEHPNTTKTLYAHLSKNLVAIGDYVTKGSLIGNMGNTGNTDGPTGCHLHFEVHGMDNPLAK